MGGKSEALATPLHNVLLVALMLQFQCHGGLSLNLEGLALLEFKSKVENDVFGALQNWNPRDPDPCKWSGVHCIAGKVETLNLPDLSFGGTLAPGLGKLSNLRSLVLCNNNFFGDIPKDLGALLMLELLDLRNNNLSGTIPAEIGKLPSLKHLMLSGNELQYGTQSITQVKMPSQLKHGKKLSLHLKKCDQRSKLMTSSSSHGCRGMQALNLPSSTKPYILHNLQHASVRRNLLEANNLAASPIVITLPEKAVSVPSIESGTFPAIPNSIGEKSNNLAETALSTDSPPIPISIPEMLANPSTLFTSEDKQSVLSKSLRKWIYLGVLTGAIVMLLAVAAALFIVRHRHGRTAIGAWKPGLSGQLQKAFIIGVPKLDRLELEAACEDFSNIINTYPDCTLFKGTLSSGVEIAVVSTVISSTLDWPRRSEMLFRKKIDSLSRVNHKNFVNLLGYCEENEPFMRMMIFEYAPNGTLFDHLHVKEYDHLDWAARMRIVMGIAYCLQYMHHELNPPVIVSDFRSRVIFLTEDNAAKIADVSIWKEVATKCSLSGDNVNPSESPFVDAGTNVYSFGILMLEVISGKVSCSEEQGSLLNWAMEYLNDKCNFKCLVDPTLKKFEDNELDVLCEAIQECVHPDSKHRPTMKEVTDKLSEVLAISPAAASPRFSPLWWAELEILSVEAS